MFRVTYCQVCKTYGVPPSEIWQAWMTTITWAPKITSASMCTYRHWKPPLPSYEYAGAKVQRFDLSRDLLSIGTHHILLYSLLEGCRILDCAYALASLDKLLEDVSVGIELGRRPYWHDLSWPLQNTHTHVNRHANSSSKPKWWKTNEGWTYCKDIFQTPWTWKGRHEVSIPPDSEWIWRNYLKFIFLTITLQYGHQNGCICLLPERRFTRTCSLALPARICIRFSSRSSSKIFRSTAYL